MKKSGIATAQTVPIGTESRHDRNMYLYSDVLYHLILYTAERKPLLEGNLRRMVEQSFKSLPGRYPGLKLVRHWIYPDRVEMLLDLQRLDEDLLRILQSFKSEVKGLAKKGGFSLHSLWQWSYEEREISRPEELLQREGG